MKVTRVCYGCKESFRKEEMVEYFSPTGKSSHWYCRNCLTEKQSREKFQTRVCEIFGLKNPGPLIWTQRKRLRDTYGYTDDAIVDCLEYLFNEKKYRTMKESLGLVAPWSMEEMKNWKKGRQAKASNIAAAIANTQTTEYIVPVRENLSKQKEEEFIDD